MKECNIKNYDESEYILNHNPKTVISDKYDYFRRDIKKAKLYTKQENKKVDNFSKKNSKLMNILFNEYDNKISDYSTYAFKTNYFSEYEYFYKIYKDKSYKEFYRIDSYGNEQLLLDINKLAEDYDYCDVSIILSNDDTIFGYGIDTKGNEKYNVYFFDINTGEKLPYQFNNIPFCDISFSPDSKSIFYVKGDYKDWLNTVYEYNINTQKNTIHYIESDNKFDVTFYFSTDETTLFINSESSDETEILFMNLNNRTKLIPIKKRSKNHSYTADLRENTLYIKTNINNPNKYIFVKASVDTPSVWRSFIEFSENNFFEDFTIWKDFIIINTKYDNTNMLWMYIFETNTVKKLNIDNDTTSSYEIRNPLYSSPYALINTITYISPLKVYKVSILDKKLVYYRYIPNFNKELYEQIRIDVPSYYGINVPVTILKKKDVNIKNSNIYLYGYGAYGMSLEPNFNPNIISILDRDIIYVIAHVRGGSEKGIKWYHDGKLNKKMNSFLDFITVADFLKNDGAKKIAIEGRSAGGLLIGSSLVLRPDLFDCAILGVPFVDIIATMSDDSIPLTTGEWKEWGNPHNKCVYENMLKYSPIDNINKIHYPNTLITTGFSDPRVKYWESLKFHKKLTDMCIDNNTHLLSCKENSGHFGNSNRIENMRETSLQQAFILYSFNINK